MISRNFSSCNYQMESQAETLLGFVEGWCFFFTDLAVNNCCECFLTDFSRFHHHFGGSRRRNFSVIQSTFHGFPAYPLLPPPGYIETCFCDQRFSNTNSKGYDIFSIDKCENQSCCWAHTLTTSNSHSTPFCLST